MGRGRPPARTAPLSRKGSGVGQPNKSIVTLSDGVSVSNLLVLEGDMRNALPVGQRVDVTFRKESGHNVLVDVDYA